MFIASFEAFHFDTLLSDLVGLSSCSEQAELLHDMWDLNSLSGIEPESLHCKVIFNHWAIRSPDL